MPMSWTSQRHQRYTLSSMSGYWNLTRPTPYPTGSYLRQNPMSLMAMTSGKYRKSWTPRSTDVAEVTDYPTWSNGMASQRNTTPGSRHPIFRTAPTLLQTSTKGTPRGQSRVLLSSTISGAGVSVWFSDSASPAQSTATLATRTVMEATQKIAINIKISSDNKQQ